MIGLPDIDRRSSTDGRGLLIRGTALKLQRCLLIGGTKEARVLEAPLRRTEGVVEVANWLQVTVVGSWLGSITVALRQTVLPGATV